MPLKNAIAVCVVASFYSGCVSAPKPDICSIDFNPNTQAPYMSCTPTDSAKEERTQSILDSLGYQCMPPEDFAQTKAYLRHLLREMDLLEEQRMSR